MTITPQPKERPILLSAPMVRAILEGRKTVARRACKPQPSANAHTTCASGTPMGAWWETGKDIIRCPYGKPGDRLWVRETWGLQVRNYGGGTGEHIVYRATNPDAIYCKSAEGREYPVKWKPSIHMHRHSSRILLEITDVRVERLQDISTEQIIAEGISTALREHDAEVDLRRQWRDLWESTGGDWQANPWVWCVSFRRAEQ